MTWTVVAAASGCGVKGDPLPPERPTEIGRGRPTFRRATEKVKVEPTEEENESDDDRGSEGAGR